MTVDEFQKKYHNYVTKNQREAMKECELVNDVLVGGEAVVANLGHFGCCLMLKSAFEFIYGKDSQSI